MNPTRDITDRETEITIYHELRMRREELTERSLIESLPVEEQADWSAVTSARVEYLNPIGDENPEALAATYLRLLTSYIETWVDPYNTGSSRRRRIYFTWVSFGNFQLPWFGLSDK